MATALSTAAPAPPPLKMVQELAGADPPANYIQRETNRPFPDGAVAAPRASLVPVVDLRRLAGEPDERDEEEAKLREALSSWGLFHVVGHGMPEGFLSSVQEVVRGFFKLPLEEKLRCSKLRDGRFLNEGYGTNNVVSPEQVLDWNDRLYLQLLPVADRKPELWPESPAAFGEVFREFTARTWEVVERVVRSIATSLGLDEECFISQFDEDTTTAFARINCYPPCPKPELVYGLKPHCDGTVVTVLLPDDNVAGFEVLKDGEWVAVSPVPDGLILNLGDLMEIMTNGIYKSPMHRAVTNSEKERISVSMFHSVGFGREVEPTEELVTEERPRAYRRVNVGEYVAVFFKHFVKGERCIDFARIA